MKTPNNIDLNQEVELVLNLPFQATPFTVTGQTEAVLDLASSIQAADALIPKQPRIRAPKVGNKVLQASTAVTRSYMGKVGLDLKTIAYDKIHGTSFYDALKQKRDDDRNLRFATSLGLISLDQVSCRKHEHAVAAMRGL